MSNVDTQVPVSAPAISLPKESSPSSSSYLPEKQPKKWGLTRKLMLFLFVQKQRNTSESENKEAPVDNIDWNVIVTELSRTVPNHPKYAFSIDECKQHYNNLMEIAGNDLRDAGYGYFTLTEQRGLIIKTLAQVSRRVLELQASKYLKEVNGLLKEIKEIQNEETNISNGLESNKEDSDADEDGLGSLPYEIPNMELIHGCLGNLDLSEDCENPTDVSSILQTIVKNYENDKNLVLSSKPPIESAKLTTLDKLVDDVFKGMQIEEATSDGATEQGSTSSPTLSKLLEMPFREKKSPTNPIRTLITLPTSNPIGESDIVTLENSANQLASYGTTTTPITSPVKEASRLPPAPSEPKMDVNAKESEDTNIENKAVVQTCYENNSVSKVENESEKTGVENEDVTPKEPGMTSVPLGTDDSLKARVETQPPQNTGGYAVLTPEKSSAPNVNSVTSNADGSLQTGELRENDSHDFKSSVTVSPVETSDTISDTSITTKPLVFDIVVKNVVPESSASAASKATLDDTTKSSTISATDETKINVSDAEDSVKRNVTPVSRKERSASTEVLDDDSSKRLTRRSVKNSTPLKPDSKSSLTTSEHATSNKIDDQDNKNRQSKMMLRLKSLHEEASTVCGTVESESNNVPRVTRARAKTSPKSKNRPPSLKGSDEISDSDPSPSRATRSRVAAASTPGTQSNFDPLLPTAEMDSNVPSPSKSEEESSKELKNRSGSPRPRTKSFSSVKDNDLTDRVPSPARTTRSRAAAVSSKVSTPQNNESSGHTLPDTSKPNVDNVPVEDSVPKVSKKVLINVWQKINDHKHAQIVQKAATEVESNPKLKKPSDVHSIRRKVDSGLIRNLPILERDFLVVLLNIYLTHQKSENPAFCEKLVEIAHDIHRITQESNDLMDQSIGTKKEESDTDAENVEKSKEVVPSTPVGRSRKRKSTVSSVNEETREKRRTLRTSTTASTTATVAWQSSRKKNLSSPDIASLSARSE